MQGNWELTAAVDANGKDILSQISFPVTALQLTDDNGMVGTHAPLATRVVYGDSKWIQAAGKMNQVFDYANLRFNTGEFFVGEGTVDNFTVEFKLQATSAAGGLSDLLSIFGVGGGWLQQVVYHKFTNVRVSFPNEQQTVFTNNNSNANRNREQIMIWEFTDQTQGFYNYKDAQGNSIIWNGWPVDRFSRGKYTFTKRTQGVNDLVQARL